ncbi:MAG TPA: NUDIX domain-containing protein, partial [Holophagaceae bacterium]|nr:NUDIX domain-containing protein [Holophagaceae bacterium]
MWLEPDAFQALIAGGPLVSLDLIVRDPGGRVLVGRRRNRPAQGWWFVPGGRVGKGERLDDAFR